MEGMPNKLLTESAERMWMWKARSLSYIFLMSVCLSVIPSAILEWN